MIGYPEMLLPNELRFFIFAGSLSRPNVPVVMLDAFNVVSVDPSPVKDLASMFPVLGLNLTETDPPEKDTPEAVESDVALVPSML